MPQIIFSLLVISLDNLSIAAMLSVSYVDLYNWTVVFNRVEAQEKMVLLREKSEKDIQQHNAEMKELIRIIDHDYKLREFMNTKGKDRDEDKQLVTWRDRKGTKLLFTATSIRFMLQLLLFCTC